MYLSVNDVQHEIVLKRASCEKNKKSSQELSSRPNENRNDGCPPDICKMFVGMFYQLESSNYIHIRGDLSPQA